MKRNYYLYFFVASFSALSIFSCSKDDNKGTFTIELDELLSVDDDQRTYAIGEVIWFNINIPNTMTDVQGKERNVRDLSGATTALTNIKFFKETGFSLPSQLRLSESDFIVELGQMELFPFETLMRTRAVFEEEGYRFRFGVTLAEAGNYFISTPSGEGDFETFFDVGNGNDTDFNLKTTLRGGDVNNRYLFSVTE